MKKTIILVLFSISAGILFTFFVLNKENFYAKEKYVVYAFQVGSFESLENAENKAKMIDSSIIIKEDGLYKVYVAMYKDVDLVNKMVNYFENNDINIYLKTINVNSNFYKTLDNYEKIIINTSDENILDKINQSILNLYLESINYE